MQLPDEAVDALVAEWVRKADLDFHTVVRLAPEDTFRDVVVFHAQQAAEKYLKALLTKRQLEFPKTHEFRRLLSSCWKPLITMSSRPFRTQSGWIRFGVEIRYPSDRPETLRGDEQRALQLAQNTRVAVTKALAQ